MFSTPPNKKPIDDLIRGGLVASGKFVFEIKINQNDLNNNNILNKFNASIALVNKPHNLIKVTPKSGRSFISSNMPTPDYAQTIQDWTIKLPDNSAIINEITSYVTKNSKERINKQIGDYTLEIAPVFDNKNNKKVFSYWAITIRTQKFNATSTNNESMALSYSNADVSYPTWTNEKGEAYFLIQKPGVRGGKSRRNIKKLSRRNKSGTRRALPKIES